MEFGNVAAQVPVAILVTAGAVLALRGVRRWRQRSREGFVARYRFPPSVARVLRETYPQLDDAQVAQVIRGLREFFAISAAAAGRRVAMPSRAVDVAWHQFIVCTRAYQGFCRLGIGRFLHHTPAEAMPGPRAMGDGLRRAWRLSCRRERIDPDRPASLPLLFAIDALLAIPDGYRYSLDCRRPGSGGVYCASDIGCSAEAGCAGDGGSDAGGGDGSGDAGGGDGGGCGGD